MHVVTVQTLLSITLQHTQKESCKRHIFTNVIERKRQIPSYFHNVVLWYFNSVCTNCDRKVIIAAGSINAKLYSPLTKRLCD